MLAGLDRRPGVRLRRSRRGKRLSEPRRDGGMKQGILLIHGAIRIWVDGGVNQPSVHADGTAKFAPCFRERLLCPPYDRGRSRSLRSEKTPLAIAVVGPGCADPRREKAPAHDPCHGVGVE